MKKTKFLFVFLIMFSFVFLAACSKVKYTVTFETGTEQTIEAQQVVENEKATKPADPTKDGYSFAGWYNGEVEYKFNEAVTEDITLTAKWEQVIYTVTFAGTEEAIEAQQVAANGKATKPADPTKEGFNFAGWYNGEVAYTFNEAVTGNITLTAKWEEIKKFTVTFAGTEEAIAAQEVVENEKATKPADPTKEGFKFVGWYNGEVEYTFNEAVTGNITLTAKWEELKKFTVTFVANGGTVKTEEVLEGSAATAPTAPEIPGKTFEGWDGDYTEVTANTVVTAIYSDNLYTVIFKVKDEVYGDENVVLYGEAVDAPADPELAGYTFLGWDADFSEITSDLVVNAKLEAIEYDIKYYSGSTELTEMEPKKYTVEDNIALNSYEVADYYFYGWYENADLEGKVTRLIEAGTTGNVTLYALNVKVEVNGGAECWSTEFPTSHDPGAGIDSISDLPETFEMDFFKYLSDNNLLTDDRIDSTCVAATWDVFSGLNPIHNGDPNRIWNDTSTGGYSAGNGYVAVFLYEEIQLNADLTVKDIKGGFLGTEPYKTKYMGLMNLLSILTQYKVENNKYIALSLNSNASRAGIGFVIDGYFYGTQGAASGYFTAARSVIPGINFTYRVNGDTVEQFNLEGNKLPTPVKDGYVFAGWCLDAECTKLLSENKATNLCTIYAKWEELK